MPMVPMKQTALVHKPGHQDDWGNVMPGETITMKCRADERTQVVQNQLGAEVVSSVQFLFDKIPNISYDDVIEYTNEIGVTVKRKPVNIEPIRMPNGKPTMTAVYI